MFVREHMYLGPFVGKIPIYVVLSTKDQPGVLNWIINLRKLPIKYAGSTVYPGHGGSSTNIK